jgi:hypothetical protein
MIWPCSLRVWSAVVLTIVLAVAVWGLFQVGWYGHRELTDIRVYEAYGRNVVVHHMVPYRDFGLEYPPAALPVFVAPALGGLSHYAAVFEVLMVACLAGAAVGALAVGGLRAGVATALMPLALGSVVVSRFDLWPAALAVLALAALLRRWYALSAVLLGTAFAAKLWPALLVPLIVIWLARRAGRSAAARWLGISFAAAAMWFVPFVAVAPAGIRQSLSEQLGRPLQIETLGGAALVAIHDLWHTPIGTSYTLGATNVTGFGARPLTAATTVVEVAAVLGIYAAFLCSQATTRDLLRSCGAAVALAIGFGKVFSPQFLIWLIPLVPLVRGRRGAMATAGLFLACLLTQLYFPSRYASYAQDLNALPTLDVLARDLVVVALGLLLAWPSSWHSTVPRRAVPLTAIRGSGAGE